MHKFSISWKITEHADEMLVAVAWFELLLRAFFVDAELLAAMGDMEELTTADEEGWGRLPFIANP